MLYEFDIAIPAGTTKDSPVRQELGLTKGVIHNLDVTFPPGCAGEVHITLARGLHQIYPTNPDGSIKSDALTVTGKTFYYLGTEPYQVEAIGWSPNASYDHVLTVRLWILRPWQLMPFSDEMFELSLKDGFGVIE